MLRKKKLKLEDIKISSFIIAQEGLNVKGRAGNTGNPYMLCFPDCMITLDCGTETCQDSCVGTCVLCTPDCNPLPGTDPWHLCLYDTGLE